MNGITVLRNLLFVLLAMGVVGLPGLAAAEESPGITVSETGVAEAMPDTVELTATVVGNAELAGDAVAKYRGNRQRIVDALNGLNIKGLTLAGSGLAINSGTPVNPMAAFQGGQAQAPVADKLAVQEELTVTLRGIDTMSAEELLQTVTRIIDVAKDSGVAIGPSSPKGILEMQLRGTKPAALATFKLSKGEELRQKAYEAALSQARAKAQALAKLAGVELGDIVSIRETAPGSKDDSGGMGVYMAMFGAAAGSSPEYTSPELQSIPVSVSLSVQFAIGK